MFRYTRRQRCRHRGAAGGANEEEFIYDFVSRPMAIVMHRRVRTNLRLGLLTRSMKVSRDTCTIQHVSPSRHDTRSVRHLSPSRHDTWSIRHVSPSRRQQVSTIFRAILQNLHSKLTFTQPWKWWHLNNKKNTSFEPKSSENQAQRRIEQNRRFSQS